MRILLSIFFLGSVFASVEAAAYGVDTHKRMSKAAIETSGVFKDANLLSSYGLEPAVREQKFPNQYGKKETIVNLVRDGSGFEDNIPRFINHFYDPIHDKGLSLGPYQGEKSPDWALGTYSGAKDALYFALTFPTEKVRNQKFGLVFQYLGHVIHHIQDMAQPQHVRNDAHPPFIESQKN